MDMQEFVRGCCECNPRADPDRAKELLKAAAELGVEILKRRRKQADIPYNRIVDEYNRICGNVLPKVTKVTDKRKRAIRCCLSQDFTVDDLYAAFRKAASTPFLTGKNERHWRAGFDFIVKPDNLVKIAEGTYGSEASSENEHSYNLDLILEHAMMNTPQIKED